MTWSAAMEEFFPFEVPPGNHSTMDNWRKMAQWFCADGIVEPRLSFLPTEQHPLSVYGWDWANDRCSVAPGGCWVNGFYAQNDTAKVLHVGTPPQWGNVVARLDPVAQLVSIVYTAGRGPSDLIRDPTGLWEVPLAQMNSDGSIADLRRYVPLPDLAPQLPGIPSYVPRGMIPQGAWGWSQGPPATQDFGQGGHNLQVLYSGSTSWFVPGRTYRYTFRAAAERWNPGQGIETMTISCYVRDVYGERRRENLITANQLGQGSAFSNTPRSMTMTIGNHGPEAVAVIELSIGNVNNIIRVPANSCSIACEDAGL